MSTSTIGVAWYSPETWQQLAAIPEARIQKTYADFVRGFDRIVRDLTMQGIKVEKLTIDIEQMTAWCHRNGYEIDDKGRSVYGSVLTMARDHPNALQGPVVDKTRVLQ